MKRLRYALEAAVLYAFYGLFAVLPVDAASNLGGWIGRTVGPRLAATRKARRNLERALPDADHAQILTGMWDNLGRTIGEFPHLEKICDPASGRVELVYGEHVAGLIDAKKPGLFFSAHLANWEVPAFTLRHVGIKLPPVYRAPNNPWTDRLLLRARHSEIRFAKGAAGARGILKHLSAGKHLGMLIDQKMNDGIAVPFFGRDAMTAPALAQFALKFQRPIVPARCERLGGCRFRVTLHAPIPLPEKGGDRHAQVLAMMTEINRILQGWVTERPQDWLWLHRRWSD